MNMNRRQSTASGLGPACFRAVYIGAVCSVGGCIYLFVFLFLGPVSSNFLFLCYSAMR